MSSIGRTFEMTPLFPCRPAILSPTEICRLLATYTLTICSTPLGSSSPRFMLLSVRSRSSIASSTAGQESLKSFFRSESFCGLRMSSCSNVSGNRWA
jgi:hypothetical protein